MIGYSNDNKARRTTQGASPTTFYEQRRLRRLRRAAPPGVMPPRVPTLGDVAGHENLLLTFDAMRRDAGRAPGPDGVTYDDLGPAEAAQVLRVVSASILAGTYMPHPALPVTIPKSGGGTRTLRIRNLADRVVSSALHRALSPYWETVFLPRSMGFRPGRGAWGLLAELEAAVVGGGLWVLTVDDVRKAFDNVVIDDAMDDHRLHIHDAKLLALIETVLRGGDPTKKVGIDQGSAYSPDALNVRLHHAHDLGVERGHHPPAWWRYADNHAYITKTAAEGVQDHDHARALLVKAGLPFKGPTDANNTDGGPVDLAKGGKVQLLGFTLSKRGDGMHFCLGKDAWGKLTMALIKAHEAENPTEIAREVIAGWINAYGPAFGSTRDDVSVRVLRTAAEQGFRETYSLEDLKRRGRSSWDRWQSLRRDVRRPTWDPDGPGDRVGAAAPPAAVDPGGV